MAFSIVQIFLGSAAIAQEACGSYFLDDTGKAEPSHEIYEKEIVLEELLTAIETVVLSKGALDLASPTIFADAGTFVWKRYAGVFFPLINAPLRWSPLITKNHRIIYTLMLKHLETLPKVMQPLYRWGQFAPEKIQTFKKGRIIRFNSFLSTTKKAEGFSSIPSKREDAVKFIIMTHKGAYDFTSIRKDEAEVMFKPGTHFRIKRVDGLNIFLEEVAPVYRPDLEAQVAQPRKELEIA